MFNPSDLADEIELVPSHKLPTMFHLYADKVKIGIMERRLFTFWLQLHPTVPPIQLGKNKMEALALAIIYANALCARFAFDADTCNNCGTVVSWDDEQAVRYFHGNKLDHHVTHCRRCEPNVVLGRKTHPYIVVE